MGSLQPSDQTEEIDREAHASDSETLWSPFAYTALLHRCLDGGMTDLRAPAQILYLQLLRETHGRGQTTVHLSHAQLRRKTGLDKDTIRQALRTLTALDLIVTLDPGGPGQPGEYQVELRTRRPANGKPAAMSLETVLQELDDDDRRDLWTLYRTLGTRARQAYEERVRANFTEIGQVPTDEQVRQGVLYLLIGDTFGRERLSKYTWYQPRRTAWSGA